MHLKQDEKIHSNLKSIWSKNNFFFHKLFFFFFWLSCFATAGDEYCESISKVNQLVVCIQLTLNTQFVIIVVIFWWSRVVGVPCRWHGWLGRWSAGVGGAGGCGGVRSYPAEVRRQGGATEGHHGSQIPSFTLQHYQHLIRYDCIRHLVYVEECGVDVDVTQVLINPLTTKIY